MVVVGGGAAGLHCAAHAAQGGKRVVVLEHNDKPGKKIRISGGGRCNFTNRVVTPQHFISNNPHFARSALSRYTPDHFIALVERYGIEWYEKTLGQLFCVGSSQQIISMLLQECAASGAEVRCSVDVHSVDQQGNFTLQTSAGPLRAQAVVVASGGLSIPSLGAGDVGYRIARSFGVPIVRTAPALVPLTFPANYGQRWQGLSGISVYSAVSAGNAEFRENILFTHRGLSGPAILQISSYIEPGDSISIDLLPQIDLPSILPHLPGEKRHLATILSQYLPQRMIDVWNDADLHVPVNTVPKHVLEECLSALHHWTVPTKGNEGYAKAEVTRGGVDTAALSSKTMECTAVPGLYFIGEVVDVTGWLGGYNFQWAWSSGYAAGVAIAES